MAYPVDQLNQNEEVVLDLRPHWWFFAKHILAVIGAIAVGIIVLAFDAPSALSLVTGVLILASLVWFGARYIVWTTTNFVVTTDRLIVRNGVLAREGIEIPLERVNTVFFRQTLFERIIRSGDLTIESASEMGSQKFTDIRRPLNVQNEIYRQMEANENRKFDRVGRNLPAAVAASIPEQIQQLDDLRKQGVLSDDEFETKKRELLDRM